MTDRISRREALSALTLLGTAGAFGARFGVPPQASHQQSLPELLIRGGRVVNATGIRTADVRVVGETIREIGPGLRAPDGAQVLDARGKLVIPGGIDPHTHLQPNFVDDFTTGSRAALAGGVTTVGTFSAPRRDETLGAAIDRLDEQIRTMSIADVILHTNIGTPRPEIVAALPEILARGQPSIKVFMVGADFGAHLGDFIKVLEAVRDAGIVTLVHCEDGALLSAAVRRLEGAGHTSLDYFAESRPVAAEVAATQQAAALCESTGAPMHVVHLSCARALEACASAKRLGVPLTVETRPLYLHLTDEDRAGPDAPLFVGQPPLRTKADVVALWDGILDGTIDFLATDHAPWTRAQKMDPALTITRLRPGVSNLQFMLPMYFSEGVRLRKMSLARFVETTSTNAARRFGLYPKKGVIDVGADADIVIWDPDLTATVRAEDDLSNADYSVFEGRRVTGWPLVTIRRGEVVYSAGAVTGKPGSGKLATRSVWRR